ncbi:cytochrome c nitrite reductase small subunit [Thalassoroseus pseudoceratinae]|uniref:cytochrome c nitrite reductase small subunit n=1 Tax=Thalassoroseus pseudoceratinae TaxID=2713176 RepID=UPI001421669F|nr:cytochrome c nitrite reductase small subunit [Thalassoroseus pseudoceratinae]
MADSAPEQPPRPPFFRALFSSSAAAIVLCVLLGTLSGVGTFTFGYGQGASYLSNDPKGCANCHVMQEYFDTWQNSSHHHVAVCNDCHLSHHPIGKWVTKADNGFFHSLAFTLQNYDEPIEIKPRNRRVTQNACLDCHQDVVHAMLPTSSVGDGSQYETQSCVHCHSNVGHAFHPISSQSVRD